MLRTVRQPILVDFRINKYFLFASKLGSRDYDICIAIAGALYSGLHLLVP